MIPDEIHKLKRKQSQRSKSMHRWARRAPIRGGLSGTPITRGLEDAYSQYKFLDPRIFGTRFVDFQDKFLVMGGWEDKQIVGYKNVEEFERLFHSVAFVITKKEAKLQLPPVSIEERYCQLSRQSSVLYNQIEKTRRKRLETKWGELDLPIVLTKRLRKHQLTGGFLYTTDEKYHQVGTEKVDLLAEMLDDFPFEEGRKVVVFCNFLGEMDAVQELLEKYTGVVRLDGSVDKISDRERIVDQLGDDREIGAAVIQVSIGEAGIDLTAADTAFFYSLPNGSYDQFSQAIARLDRYGQLLPVTIVLLIAEGTVDEDILDTLEYRDSLAERHVRSKSHQLPEGESNMARRKSGEDLDQKLDELEKDLQGEEEQKPARRTRSKPAAATKKTSTRKKAAAPAEDKPARTRKKPADAKAPAAAKKKPAAKKPAATAGRGRKVSEGMAGVADLANDSGLDAGAVRRKLRALEAKDEVTKPANGWEWKVGGRDYQRVLKKLTAGK